MAKEVTIYEFDSEVLDSSKPAVVDFYADWCGPCKMLAPVINELSQEMSGCEFFKVNIDNDADLASRYGVMSIPTVMVFKGGKPVMTSVGYISKQELAGKIEDAVNGR
ncbi:MAG: thioredoxin [Oscillospiraceae bacterium]|nr:thioredoxin [Oscillospiraceae bacterium]